MDGLTDDHCRYVIGEVGVEWCFCRRPRSRRPDGSYAQGMWCDGHRMIVMTVARPYTGKLRPKRAA